MKKTKFEINMTGFVIALLLVALMATVFGGFISDLETDAGISGNVSLTDYDHSTELTAMMEELNTDTTKLASDQDSSILDIVGSYFKKGWTSIKISAKSMNIFEGMMTTASNDLDGSVNFSLYSNIFYVVIIVALLLGVIVTVLVKMRI